MSAWSRNRKMIIVVYILLLFVLLCTTVYFFWIYKTPSCFDGKKNGSEEGLDCGGGCQLVCGFSAAEPNIAWSRALEIGPGVYNFASEIENPNFDLGGNLQYVFRAFNSDNVQVAEVFGSTVMYPTQKQVVFEPSVFTDKSKVNRVFLDVVSKPKWYRIKPLVKSIVSQEYTLEDTQSSPKLEVNLYNSSFRSVSGIDVVAVLYDQDENVYQVSKTFVEYIGGDNTAQAFFTWRDAFDKQIQRVEFFITEPQDD